MASEAEILERVKAGMRQPAKDIPSLRGFIEKGQTALNARAPEIGAFHADVELRPGLRADIAVPKGAGPFPIVLYLHGGGWVAGSPKSHQKLGMQFAEQGYLTINLDYRLAPEHPFPAGFEDCLFAVRWTIANGTRWSGDPSRLAVGGDSAGANLAAATMIALGAEPNPPVRFKAGLLIYGLFDVPAVIARRDPSMGLDMMARAYLADRYPDLLGDPRVSPFKAIKAGALPPQFIICGDDDPLLAESRAIAEACQRAGIEHELHVVPDMPHGYIQVWMLSAAGASLRTMFDFMRRHI